MGSTSQNLIGDLQARVRSLEEKLAQQGAQNPKTELYRALFETSRDGLLVVDDEGIYVEVNEAYAGLLKSTPREIGGRHFSEFVPPDRLADAQAAFASLKSGGAGLPEFPLRATDGTLVHCEWTCQSHFLPGLTLCCAREITARRQAEEAVRTSNERQRLAAEAGNVGLWDWDLPTGRIIWSERMYDFHGLPPGSFAGTAEAFAAMVHPADRERLAESIRESMGGTNPSHFEFRAIRPDGEIRWLSTSGRIFRDEAGNPVRMLGTTIDITERRESEQALLRSNEQLEEFAYAVSHDLQEPLRTISIYTPLLVDRFVPENPTARKYSDFITQAAGRMETLINDLLTYSRVIHFDARPAAKVDLEGALAQTLDVLRDAMTEANAIIECDPLPHAAGDESQISLVFQNLLSNALKYRKNDRPLRVEIRVVDGDAGFVTLCVADNGIGFDPAYAETIFGLFKRLHSKGYPGTGLGLAICRRILLRYGGRIWAESEPGIGSRFFFCVPSL